MAHTDQLFLISDARQLDKYQPAVPANLAADFILPPLPALDLHTLAITNGAFITRTGRLCKSPTGHDADARPLYRLSVATIFALLRRGVIRWSNTRRAWCSFASVAKEDCIFTTRSH